jgi:hypothetical protein
MQFGTGIMVAHYNALSGLTDGAMIMATAGTGIKQRSGRKRMYGLLEKIRRFLKRESEPPEDPYSYVGAPKKPRPPHRSAAAAERLD